MEYIKATEQAGFISQHGECICVEGEWNSDSLPLKDALHKLGAKFNTMEDYSNANSRIQNNLMGPNVVLILDAKNPRQYNSWSTVFVLPKLLPAPHIASWIREASRAYECYFWQNDRWEQQDRQGTTATFMKPFSKHADRMFQEQILGVHPELVEYWHRIYPVYAGANEDHAIDRVNHMEVLSAIEKALGRGKDKVIFSNADEALQPQSIHKAHRFIDQLDYMPSNTWFMLTSSLDGTASYNHMCQLMGIQPKMKIISGMRFENVTKTSMEVGYEGNRTLDFTKHPVWAGKEFKIGKREKKLLCFNRMPRWQRARMVGFLFEHDLIEKSYVSFDIKNSDIVLSTRSSWDIKNNKDIDKEFRDDPYIENIYKLWNRLPLVLNRTSGRDNPVDINVEDAGYFDNSYFSVVNETNFYHNLIDTGTRPCCCIHTDGVFISEKVYKPIAHRHPFIVAALPGTLKYLRVVGYKTFEGLFNEDYDTIKDDNDRHVAIEQEILRLTNLTDDEWLELQVKLKPIIDYNYNHFLSLKKLNTTDYDLVAEF
jgi:hypothetical protein